MRNFKPLFFLGAFIFALVFSAQAQLSLPNPADFKKDMMGAMLPGDDLGLSNKQKDDLKKQNESFLNDVIGIANGNDSDEGKLSAIKGLAGKNNSALSGIFGDDQLLKSYRKKIKKQIRPFKTKYKLAKLVL